MMDLYDDLDDEVLGGDSWNAPTTKLIIKPKEIIDLVDKPVIPAFLAKPKLSPTFHTTRTLPQSPKIVQPSPTTPRKLAAVITSPTAIAPSILNPAKRKQVAAVTQQSFGTTQAPSLNHVVDLSNQKERKKSVDKEKKRAVPQLAHAVIATASGTLLHVRPKKTDLNAAPAKPAKILGKADSLDDEEYDPRRPNNYPDVKPKLQRETNPDFAEDGKMKAAEILAKLNTQIVTKVAPTTVILKEPKPVINTAKLLGTTAYDSSSDEEGGAAQRPTGGAQIAPPSFLAESGPQRSGTFAEKHLQKKKPIVPLFKRAKLNPDVQAKKDDKLPSRDTIVICIKNAVGAGEVDDTLREDFNDECSKFGKVLDVKIVDLNAVGISCSEEEAVRVFVKYMSVQDSRKAYDALNGRFFGGRTIAVAFFDVSKFDRNELLGKA